MKVLLCCILKLENRYLDEWINYYKKLGVNKIVIYDNNDTSGEFAEDIKTVKAVKDGLSSNLIDIYPTSSVHGIYLQTAVYDDCYDKYQKDYDGLMFFDLDEFLVLEKFDKIQDFLAQPKFDKFDQIHINGKLYDDNNIIKPPKKYKVFDTYTRELSDTIPDRFEFNTEMKSIIRGNLGKVQHKNAHTLYNNGTIRSCNSLGIEDSVAGFISKYPIHKGAGLNHYITKSLDEYFNIKLKRLISNNGSITSPSRVNCEFFFMYNECTPEKIKHLKKYIPDINEKMFMEEIRKKIGSQYDMIKKEQAIYNLKLDTNNFQEVKEISKNLSFSSSNKNKKEEKEFEFTKLIFK